MSDINRFKITGTKVNVIPDENGPWVSYNDYLKVLNVSTNNDTRDNNSDTSFDDIDVLSGVESIKDTVIAEKDKIIEQLTQSISDIKIKSLSEASEYAGFYLKQLKDLKYSLKNRGLTLSIKHPDGSTE